METTNGNNKCKLICGLSQVEKLQDAKQNPRQTQKLAAISHPFLHFAFLKTFIICTSKILQV
jgi:hypothetical protein